MWDFLQIIGSIYDDINCYEPGKDYTGNDLNDGYNTLKDSAKECQELCQQNSACVGFTWVKDRLSDKGRECWLKSHMDNFTYNDDVVSGPRYCGMLIGNIHRNI